MNEPTQEQIKEFLEWCGWKEKPIARSFRTIDWPDYAWHDPNGEAHPDTGLPPIDLNNLFKYVPKRMTNALWRKIIREWASCLTGDYGKDTLLLFAQTYAIMKEKQG